MAVHKKGAYSPTLRKKFNGHKNVQVRSGSVILIYGSADPNTRPDSEHFFLNTDGFQKLYGHQQQRGDDSKLGNFCDGGKVSNSRDASIFSTPATARTTATEGKQATEKRPKDIRNASNNRGANNGRDASSSGDECNKS